MRPTSSGCSSPRGSFVPASKANFNPAEFCDPATGALMDNARRQPSPAEANAQWARADRRVVDLARFVAFGNPTWVDLTSTRVHNYQRSPSLGVLLAEMWIR